MIMQYRVDSCLCKFVTLLVFLLIGYIFEANAQSGIVSGQIIDAETGESLKGVSVGLSGTNSKVITDVNGRFILRSIPLGEHSLVISSLGYQNKERTISITDSERPYLNIELVADTIFEGDEIFMNRRKKANGLAINRQKEGVNFSYILTANQIDRFTDYTVAEALTRVPAVQIGHDGDVNIRGTGFNLYNVTVDGQRLGTTGKGNRSVDLASISIDNIEEIEVIKVVTPDMDAEALGGVVNINTIRPIRGQRDLSVRLDGGANTRYFDQTGIENRVAIKYADSPQEDLSYSIRLSHQRDQRPFETLQLDYDVMDFGNGLVDVIERVSPSLQTDERNRLDAGLHLAYQPSDRTTFNLRGLYINDNREFIQHGIGWSAGGDWIDQNTTGDTGSQGLYDYDTVLRETEIQHYSIQLSAKHLFNRFDLEYNAGWAQGSIDQQEDIFPFQLGGLNYDINWDNRNRPFMIVNNLPLQHDSTIDPRRVGFQDIDRIFNNHIDNKYTGRIDIGIPFRFGEFKFGSSAILTIKDGDFSDSRYNYLRARNLHQFKLIRDKRYRVLNNDEYYIPQFVDPHAARMFYYGNRPIFTLDQTRYHERTHQWNHAVNENIYSTYGMTSLELNRLVFLFGVRMEHTASKYDGRIVEFDDIGTFLEFNDSSQSNSYTNFFPNAQLIYGLGDRTKIRLAYSQTIARPNFNYLAPFEIINEETSNIFSGNPELSPMFSDNIDFHIEHYTHNSSYFAIGLFYKELTNFVYQTQTTIESGDFQGWTERTFVNGHEAELYGVEFNWHQNFTFLPGFLSNFESYVNYSWMQSSFDTFNRDDEVSLPGQSPHIINAALGYTQGRFTGQIAYHWSAAYLDSLADNLQQAPSIDSSNMVYLDSYQDGWSDLSLSMGFRISNNFRLWANASNLLNTELIRYDQNRDLYPRVIDNRGGRELKFGIRFNL